MPDATARFLSWLRDRHQTIQRLEQQAQDAIYKDGDEQAYRGKMRARAELIAALDSDAAALVADLPGSIREEAESALNCFARGGRNALRIESVFYMSALLYPDEHKPGEPDNLQLLLRRLGGD